MARTGKLNKIVKVFCGMTLSVFVSQLVLVNRVSKISDTCAELNPFDSIEESRGIFENANRSNLLYVGVMTAANFVDTRAKVLYETWGREVPGMINFYSSEGSKSPHIPLVALQGVDDSYPPQRKSFMMLKHMHDHFIDQFEWFMRADDDVYVRQDRLEEFLRSVDSKKPWFIGQTGRGNSEEFGLLSMENDDNYCMGGPGVIFSRETLRRVAPYVEECLSHLYTTHEDVEVGRCVRRFAGVSCTWSYEASDCTCKMQVILYHNQSGPAAFTGDLNQKEVHRAITLHPIKQPQHMRRLHKYIKSLKMQDQLHEVMQLYRDISMSETELDKSDKDKLDDITLSHLSKDSDYIEENELLGKPSSLNRYVPTSLKNVLEWEFISKNLFSHRDFNPRRRVGSSIKTGLHDIVREVMELINSYSKQRGRIIDFREILYGYWRLDPLHGVDLILDMLLVYRKYRGRKMTMQVRRHAYIQQTFSDIYIREVGVEEPTVTLPSSSQVSVPVHKQLVNKLIQLKDNLQPYFTFGRTQEATINFLLPLSGRLTIFKRFLKMYDDICLAKNEDTHLFIILYKDQKNPKDFNETINILKNFQYKYGKNRISLLEVQEEFSRGKALQYAVNLLKDDDLMLFIDVDMIFNSETLRRIRCNTRLNKSVYFPIVYSLYNPKILNKTYENEEYSEFSPALVDEDNGFWRQFGFGITSLYKNDYINLGGFNLSISGWGAEDVNLYDNVIKSNLTIFRAPDPTLIHVYHAINCDSNLDFVQKTMCLGTQANTLGSLSQLQRLFYKYKFLFR